LCLRSQNPVLGLTQGASGNPKETAAVFDVPPPRAFRDVGADAVCGAQQLTADYILLEFRPGLDRAMQFRRELSGEPVSRKIPKCARHTELSAARPILSPCDL
jgi:hypothetical protein